MSPSTSTHPDGNQFLEMVQNHERQWGQADYTGRPTLKRLLEAPVVVFWRTANDTPPVVTTYDALEEVGRQLARQLIVGDKIDRGLMKIFVDRRPMRIASVNVEFAEDA